MSMIHDGCDIGPATINADTTTPTRSPSGYFANRIIGEIVMAFELPKLPFERTALAPHMSAETLDYHYGKHHNAYVTKANGAIEGTSDAKATNADLPEIIQRERSGFLFNQAAQIWNHTFFWHCLTPGGRQPSGEFKTELERYFGSVEDFKQQFGNAAQAVFGAGWTWLVARDNALEIVNTPNAENPLLENARPLLTVDMWEHAYYIDYRNAKPDFLDAFWAIADFESAARRLYGT